MVCPEIKSVVRRKVDGRGNPYFLVFHNVGSGRKKRILHDCEHFPSRQAAKDKIPELDADLKLSIEQGIL